MASLYADEQFPLPVVELLRNLGHDVLTVQAAGNAGHSDLEVLAFAVSNERAVLTQNRRHFIRLHSQHSDHAGIVLLANIMEGFLLTNFLKSRLNQIYNKEIKNTKF